MNYYMTTTGVKWSQATIDRKLREVYAQADEVDHYICECCGKYPPDHHDHTISRKRCKELGKADLIIDRKNWSYSCALCHGQWESYKSSLFTHHRNYIIRMEYLKEHDPGGYEKRKNFIISHT